MVGGDENAHSADTHEDTNDLGDVVADLEEEEGDDDYDGYRPEVDELGAEHGSVAVGEDDEVVPFHIAKGKNDIFGGRLVGILCGLGWGREN